MSHEDVTINLVINGWISCTLIIHNRVGAPDPDPNLATVIRMVFDRLSIVPTFQYKFSRIISLWELHCFYLTARTYLPLHEYLSPLVGGNADLALNTILRTFKDYSTGWMIAGKERNEVTCSSR